MVKFKKLLNAEVIERRGRMTVIKFADGLTGSFPDCSMPPGSVILISIEKKE